jgi:hypothetical protein
MMFYDGVRACSIFSLFIQDKNCDENTTERREDYAKIALLMFHPLRKLDDIIMDGESFASSKETRRQPCGRRGLKYYRT